MKEEIKFYRTGDDFGCFSNFARADIKLDGKMWRTTEHYFQAQKFRDAAYKEKIRTVASPGVAARLGRSRKVELRRDWESIKEGVMLKALRAKFTQHEKFKRTLLSTGDAQLIEHTTNDSYWGDGGDGSGKNQLGELLMLLREELRTEDEDPPPGRSANEGSRE